MANHLTLAARVWGDNYVTLLIFAISTKLMKEQLDKNIKQLNIKQNTNKCCGVERALKFSIHHAPFLFTTEFLLWVLGDKRI